MNLPIQSMGLGLAVVAICGVAIVLIICVTCVVIVIKTDDTEGLRDFAEVIRAWRRKKRKTKAPAQAPPPLDVDDAPGSSVIPTAHVTGEESTPSGQHASRVATVLPNAVVTIADR